MNLDIDIIIHFVSLIIYVALYFILLPKAKACKDIRYLLVIKYSLAIVLTLNIPYLIINLLKLKVFISDSLQTEVYILSIICSIILLLIGNNKIKSAQ